MQNNRVLMIIAISLIGIFAVMAMNYYHEKHNTSTVEKISNDLAEFGEEVKDEIDDHTTN